MNQDQLFHKKKIRTSKELSRRKANKDPHETISIFVEGKCDYFKQLIKFHRLNTANIFVTPGRGSAPISIIDHSIEEAQNRPDIDRIACVIDRDDHESYERAINKLHHHNANQNNKNKFILITNTPCFEIWLLLHFRYTNKPYNSIGKKSAADRVLKELQKECPKYTKSNVDWYDCLKNKIEFAIKNARQLTKHNTKTNSTNPATNMHELVEYLINLKK